MVNRYGTLAHMPPIQCRKSLFEKAVRRAGRSDRVRNTAFLGLRGVQGDMASMAT